MESEEEFTDSQVRTAIDAFLEYGEKSLVKRLEPYTAGHHGYFSGDGWAARCLRYHLRKLEEGKNGS